MSTSRQAAAAILAMILVAGIILGSMVVAMRERMVDETLDPSLGETQMAVSLASPETGSPHYLTSAPGRWSATPTLTRTSTLTPLPTITVTPTLTFTPTVCPLPDGWQIITIASSDSLESLVAQYQVTAEELLLVNCLTEPVLTLGMVFYVPPQPVEAESPHPRVNRCGPPAGWIQYTVRHGDTLYSLSLAMGIHYSLLQQANCMGSSTLIRTGQALWVPFGPTDTPQPAPGFTATVVPAPSATAMPPPTSTQVDPTLPGDNPTPTDSPDPG